MISAQQQSLAAYYSPFNTPRFTLWATHNLSGRVRIPNGANVSGHDFPVDPMSRPSLMRLQVHPNFAKKNLAPKLNSIQASQIAFATALEKK